MHYLTIMHSIFLDFDMDQVDPNEMISLARVNKRVSLGEQINVQCNSSSYYFAK